MQKITRQGPKYGIIYVQIIDSNKNKVWRHVRFLLDVSFTIQPHAHGLFMRNRRDVRRELENASGIITISTYHRAYIAEMCPGIDGAVPVWLPTEHDQDQLAIRDLEPSATADASQTLKSVSLLLYAEQRGGWTAATPMLWWARRSLFPP